MLNHHTLAGAPEEANFELIPGGVGGEWSAGSQSQGTPS